LITNATSYAWVYSGTGATITGTSNSVTITFASNASSGNLTVQGSNACGNGTISANYAIIVNPLPAAAGTITGTASVCQGQSSVSYSVPLITNSTSYTWVYSGTGATITGTSNSVTITFASNATSGNLTVQGVNSCGNGVISANYSIVVNLLPVIPSQTSSTLSGAPFIYPPTGGTIPAGTTYTWPVPALTGGVTGGAASIGSQTTINGTLTIPSGTGTAIYTVIPTSLAGCIGAPFTVTVNVSSTCTPVSIGTQPVNSSMCATSGSTTFIVVASGTGPFTYQWQYYNGSAWANVVNGTPAGAIYTTSATATLGVAGITSAGSYQYHCYITNCSGGNNISSNAATLTVNAQPVPTLTSSDPDNTFCLGTSVTFTAGGGTNYDFRIGGVTVQNGSSTTYTTASLANGQIVTVVVTNSIGCLATSAQIQNIVYPLPYLIISTPATCSSDFLTYSFGVTVTPGALVTSSSGTVINTSSNLWTISGVLAGINTTVTVTDTKGCQTIQSVTAPNCACPVVLPPVSGGDKFYCAGGVIPALTATVLAGETVDWYNASSGGTLLRSGSLSYTPTAPGTYYALARNTASNCVSSTRTAITVTMNPLPVATLTSSDADNIFCSGTSVIFSATGGTNYNFLVGGLSVQNGVSATYTTSSLTNGQTVAVIVTNANGCTATSAGITNTVSITPVPTLTSSDADNNFCLGTSVTFTASGGTNYNFRVDGVSVQTGLLTTYSTSTLTNGQVVDVIVSNTNGCTATSAGITNSVFESPIANAGTGGNNCGLQFHLNGSLTVGTGTWSKISGSGNATFSPDANTANAIVTVTAYGSYTFGWTVANGTCSTSATVTVVFIQQPPANAGTGGDVCGESFTMNAPVATGLGTWAKISGPGNAVFTPDNHHPDATVTVDQFGSYNFEWTLVNSTCTSTGIIKVVFHDLPPINAGRDTALCKGSSVQLQAKGTGTVAWVPAALLSNPNIINPIATPDTTTTFTVNLTDQFGCKNSSDIVVEVREKTIANAGPDQVLGYQFTATMNALLAHSYENGVWSVISGTGDFVDSTNAKTTVKSLSPGTNKFLWTVTNGYCPLSHDTTMISVIEFIIPTLITPNGDGRNDYFVLRGLTTTLGKTELIIFDRRGAQVYKNLNYDNSWNGLDYNKKPLPDDTYFYVIKSANGKSISGYIVIRR
jgi:gliding motility-associated-like protein